MAAGEVLRKPAADVMEATAIGRYLSWLNESRGLAIEGYAGLHSWSVSELGEFWGSIWEHFAVIDHGGWDEALGDPSMPGARWFEGARINFAEHVLRGDQAKPAIVGRSQTRDRIELTKTELGDQVARVRAGLVRLGVGKGDRVAAYMPNTPETLVVCLATASLGAIFSSCAPEFGTRSVVDRLSQVEPKVLFAVDGYGYGGKSIDRVAEVAEIRAALPSLEATVSVPYLGDDPAVIPGATSWDELFAEAASLEFEPVPFDHPLFILFSSGTTGLPKPIVHGHGGILLEQLKVHALHNDLGPGDTFFWFTTTGWVMWNLLISGLLVDAKIVMFDGNPGHPDLMSLWRMADEEDVSFFGTSAPFLLSCRKAGIEPGSELGLTALRSVGSTGAPLPAEGFRWVYEQFGPQTMLTSISGGTDIASAFVGGSPLQNVWAGEIAGACLGVDVHAFDQTGQPVIGSLGELVVTQPMPSMPVGFWGDSDGSRYRAAYFEDFPGVWRHGDWIEISERGTCAITGRSDATLNRGGVRLGTSEFYSTVEAIPGVADSLVVHLEDSEGGAGELILFVAVAGGGELDEALTKGITSALRGELSPRHVPDRIVAAPSIPRTLTGKKLEVPVKKILRGASAEDVASRGSLEDPGALAFYEDLASAGGQIS